MRSFLLFALLLIIAIAAKAQQVDSICFHLYTDSLKKGTYNYINVDGRLSNGRWLPLTDKEISFTATAGNFTGNSLFIEQSAAVEKVTIRAMLKSNPQMLKETTIYVKKTGDNELPASAAEIAGKNSQTRTSDWKKLAAARHHTQSGN